MTLYAALFSTSRPPNYAFRERSSCSRRTNPSKDHKRRNNNRVMKSRALASPFLGDLQECIFGAATSCSAYVIDRYKYVDLLPLMICACVNEMNHKRTKEKPDRVVLVFSAILKLAPCSSKPVLKPVYEFSPIGWNKSERYVNPT